MIDSRDFNEQLWAVAQQGNISRVSTTGVLSWKEEDEEGFKRGYWITWENFWDNKTETLYCGLGGPQTQLLIYRWCLDMQGKKWR